MYQIPLIDSGNPLETLSGLKKQLYVKISIIFQPKDRFFTLRWRPKTLSQERISYLLYISTICLFFYSLQTFIKIRFDRRKLWPLDKRPNHWPSTKPSDRNSSSELQPSPISSINGYNEQRHYKSLEWLSVKCISCI